MNEFLVDEIRPWLKASIAWDNLISDLSGRGELTPQSAAFVDQLISASIARETTLPTTTAIFRARWMPVERAFDSEPLDLTEMGAPPATAARHNRLSPTGDPAFYGALESDTAVAEVRPWVTARVSIAKFEPSRPLRLVDLTREDDDSHFDDADWTGWIMSRPVHQEDTDSYLGTQLLATRFKALGFDGVLYRSRLREGGVNAAIFDGALLNGTSAELQEVTRVAYSTSVLSPFPTS